jgi:hypothetical protein
VRDASSSTGSVSNSISTNTSVDREPSDRSPGAHGGCENGDQQEQNDDADADTVRVQVHVRHSEISCRRSLSVDYNTPQWRL